MKFDNPDLTWMAYRFSCLPLRSQYDIAKTLNVLQDSDVSLNGEAFIRAVFQRVRETGVCDRLWDETEKLHASPLKENPFRPDPNHLAPGSAVMKDGHKYNIIRAFDYADMVTFVNQAIEVGWSPLGGVCCASCDDDRIVLFQAMTRKQ